MADKRYAGTSALSAIFSQIKAAINEKVTKVSGKDVVNVDVENLLCNEQTDGSYVLTAVVSSGILVYNWGEGVPGGGGFTDITYEEWRELSPQEQAAKDYYISDYPSSVYTAGNIGYDNTESGMDADDVQEAIDELHDDLTDAAQVINHTISYSAQDLHITGVNAFKNANTVCVTVATSLSNYTAGQWYVIGTLPSELRPRAEMRFCAYNNTIISKDKAYTYPVRIKTDGELAVYVWGDVTDSVSISQAFTYIADDVA